MKKVNIEFIYYVNNEEIRQKIDARVGASILQITREHELPLEGACEGSLACSTCHVVIDVTHYNNLPTASEDEEDMLDLAFGLTATSRLGCQVMVTEDMEGASFMIPSATRNL